MQKITQKKLVTSVAAAALVFGLAACDNDAEEQDQDAADSQEEQPEMPDDMEQPEMPEPDLGDVPDVVAEVNGEDIDGEEYASTYEGQFAQMAMQAQMSGEPVDEEALQEQVLDNLIGLELLRQDAEESGVEVSSEEIDEQLEEMAEANGMESVEELFEMAEEEDLSEDDLRKDVELEVTIDKLIESLDVEEPTDEEVEEAYDEFAAQQAPPAEGEGEDDEEEAETPDLEELRPEIEQQLTEQKEGEAVMAYIDELRESAEVEIHV